MKKILKTKKAMIIIILGSTNKDLSRREITKKLNSHTSNTYGIISMLERQGFVNFEKPKAVKLTDKGKKLSEYLIKLDELLK